MFTHACEYRDYLRVVYLIGVRLNSILSWEGYAGKFFNLGDLDSWRVRHTLGVYHLA